MLGPVLLLLVAGCSSPTGQAGDDLRENRGRWQALGLHDYSFEFRRVCFCGGPIQPLRVVVRGDTVASITDAATGERPAIVPPGWTGTVGQIFDRLIEDSGRVAEMELTFDATYHFPAHVRVDRIANAIDDEYELRLSSLTPGS